MRIRHVPEQNSIQANRDSGIDLMCQRMGLFRVGEISPRCLWVGLRLKEERWKETDAILY